MKQDVHDALDAEFDGHRIVRQLHDVPPHEVWAVRVDGRRAVCKRDTGPTGTSAIEGRVTAFVGAETAVPVPGVLALGDDYYVAAWHPNAPEPDAGADPDEAWARAAGRGLATLHDETTDYVDSYGHFEPVAGDNVSVDGENDWHAAARAYVRRRRPVLADYGHGDVADAVLDYLGEHPDALAGAGAPVCCHGWWTPDHVAVGAGETACVLDFEHALAAPGEWDVWRTLLPAFGCRSADEHARRSLVAFEGDGDPARRAFLDGYESVRALPDGFEARRPLYVVLNGVYYVESLYVQDQHGEAETEKQVGWFRESVFETLDALP
jgi:fructosamine-3-kinase